MKQLLIVVDYQVDFVSGSLGFPAAAALEPAIEQAILACRKAGGDVWFTLDTHGSDYLATQEGRRLPVPHCIQGTEGWNLYGKIAGLLQKEDRLFEKNTFGSLALANALGQAAYENVTLVGLVSHICVLTNAVLAKTALPEARVLVDVSCTAGLDPVLHQQALDVLKGLQIDLI